MRRRTCPTCYASRRRASPAPRYASRTLATMAPRSRSSPAASRRWASARTSRDSIPDDLRAAAQRPRPRRGRRLALDRERRPGAALRGFGAPANTDPITRRNLLDGDGIFNPELKKVLDGLGKPKPETDRERELLGRLSGAIDESALVLPQGQRAPDPQDVQRVAGFVLDQLAGRNAQISGPGAADAKAIRTGTDLLRVFKPRVLGITLQSADVAHGSYNSYVEVIRRNDEELGRLWDAIQQDDALRDTTAVFVLPEFGRDQDLNERNGLDHGDGSKALLKVFLIAAGPDFKRGKVLKDELRSIDVCPTVLALFGERAARGVDGKVIRGLFA